MPGGLAELVSLGVDPAGMPLRGIAYLDEQRRVEAPFRGSVGRGVRRTTLHAALASRAKEQDTEWISTRITNVDQDAHGVGGGHGSRGPREMADCRRRLAFGGPPRRRYQRGGRTSTTVRGSLALPSAGVVRFRRSPLVAVGRSVCDTRRARPCRGGDPVARAPDLAWFPGLAHHLQDADRGRPRGCGPMRQVVSRRVAGRVLLVGDAAGYEDALTGEGVSLAVKQAAAAVRLSPTTCPRHTNRPGVEPLATTDCSPVGWC